MTAVTKLAKSFFDFWWDFIIGDDARIAIGVAVGLGLVAGLHAAAVPAWWALPVLWVLALIWSVRRVARH
jgi:hypothetical protein